MVYRLAGRLSVAGHEVETATVASIGRTLIDAREPDLVVLAADVPGAQAVTDHARSAGIPVILLTQEDVITGLEDAAAGLLARSTAPDRIAAAVRAALRREAAAESGADQRPAMPMLVVEADPEHRRAIAASLDLPGRERITTTWAGDLREAMAALRSTPFACVIVSHDLPDGPGIELVDQIDEELITTPVVALLPADDPALAAEYFRSGAVDVLCRPDVLGADGLRRGVAQAIARHQRRALATIIERHRLGEAVVQAQEGLISLARTDRLTGICNRAVFEDYFPVFHAELVAAERPYTVALADVDRFKAFNDEYGHAAGDDALRAVATGLAGGLRGDDFVARYGGEEFVLLLSGIGPPEAGTVLDRLRAGVAAAAVEHSGNPPHGSVTVSIGAASYRPGDATTTARLLRRADNALYAAKAAGRNAVIVAERTEEAAGIEMSS